MVKWTFNLIEDGDSRHKAYRCWLNHALSIRTLSILAWTVTLLEQTLWVCIGRVCGWYSDS